MRVAPLMEPTNKMTQGLRHTERPRQERQMERACCSASRVLNKMKERTRSQAAKCNARISSKIRRKAGSGAWHMVRYVSRKGSQTVRLSTLLRALIVPAFLGARNREAV